MEGKGGAPPVVMSPVVRDEGISDAAAVAAAAGGEKDSSSPTPSPPAVSSVLAQPGITMGMGIGMMGSGSGEDLTRKKRGRPRKYGPDSMALVLSPLSPDFSSSSGKRGRGRPPGSGRQQTLAALGEWFAYSAGGNFTPHVVAIATGEDVSARISSFSQKGPRSICILSANGAISNVTLCQPGSSGGTLTYEGRFEILSLSGSFTFTEDGGIRRRTGGISVSLAGPDGRVVGGGVAGSLVAASPIQVVVGSFVPNVVKEHKKKPTSESSTYPSIPNSSGFLTAARPISQAIPDEDCEIPTATMLPARNHDETGNSVNRSSSPNSGSFRTAGWHGLQASSEHKPSPDINICLAGE